MREIRADEGDTHGCDAWLHQNPAIRRNVSEHPPGPRGWAVVPQRWVVERAMAGTGRHRVARKAYNRTPESREAFLYLGSVALLLNRRSPRCSFVITLSVLGSQFSVLGSWFLVFGSWFSVLGSQFSVLGSRSRSP